MKPKPKQRKLSLRQELFCHEFVKDLNQTQAYIRAGYSPKHANKLATRLMGNEGVKARIAELQKKVFDIAKIEASDVLNELAKIAFADVTNYLEFDGETLSVKPFDQLKPAHTAAIAEFSQVETRENTRHKFKLHDKMRALEALGKHLKLFAPDTQINVNVEKQTIVFGGKEITFG
jgi:phage terminase small subunit